MPSKKLMLQWLVYLIQINDEHMTKLEVNRHLNKGNLEVEVVDILLIFVKEGLVTKIS